MTLNELKNTLDSLGVRNDAYSLKGGLPSEAYCINGENGCWEVYYSERGKKTGLKNYRNEAEACKAFLQIVREDQSVFSKQSPKP